MNRRIFIAASLAFAAGSPAAADYIDVDGVPDCINSTGAVAGYIFGSHDALYGFVRSPTGQFTMITTAFSTVPTGIADDGTITGYDQDTAGGTPHGFLRTPDGTIVHFDANGADGRTQPAAISSNGLITGSADDAARVSHGFVRTRDGRLHLFDVPGAGTAAGQGTFPGAIGSNGATAGSFLDANNVIHGFIRTHYGAFTTFDAPCPNPGPYQGTSVAGFNHRGQATGVCNDANGTHGFVRAPDGTITLFDVSGATTTTAAGINRAGTVTGMFTDDTGTSHGFLRAHDGTIQTFDCASRGMGPGQGAFPTAISDPGDVAGMCVQYQRYYGFITTP